MTLGNYQLEIAFDTLVQGIAQIITQARGQVRQAVNSAMVQSYVALKKP